MCFYFKLIQKFFRKVSFLTFKCLEIFLYIFSSLYNFITLGLENVACIISALRFFWGFFVDRRLTLKIKKKVQIFLRSTQSSIMQTAYLLQVDSKSNYLWVFLNRGLSSLCLKNTYSLLSLSLVRFHFRLKFVYQVLKSENIFPIFFRLKDDKNHRVLVQKHTTVVSLHGSISYIYKECLADRNCCCTW